MVGTDERRGVCGGGLISFSGRGTSTDRGFLLASVLRKRKLKIELVSV